MRNPVAGERRLSRQPQDQAAGRRGGLHVELEGAGDGAGGAGEDPAFGALDFVEGVEGVDFDLSGADEDLAGAAGAAAADRGDRDPGVFGDLEDHLALGDVAVGLGADEFNAARCVHEMASEAASRGWNDKVGSVDIDPSAYRDLPENPHGIQAGSLLFPTETPIVFGGGTSADFVRQQGGGSDTFVFVLGLRDFPLLSSTIEIVEGVFLDGEGPGFHPTWDFDQLMGEVQRGGWRVVPTHQVLIDWIAEVEARANR